jgi:hypothetical protein
MQNCRRLYLELHRPSPYIKINVYPNDTRLGAALLERDATHPLPAPMAIPITMRFTIHPRGPRKRHIRRFCFPMVDFDANWLTFASQLALSFEEPSSLSAGALLFWKRMIGQQIAVQSFGLRQSL